ncbi:G protein-coupled glucose receptor regulating Gpa2-domain-containing protein [Lophiotrema nucula]|uniref:G protein-coupled glucose receptor regulating Gpa2-domain-containing protein n=1 Tax=Lophiotrema nucula TaxID=690887 RepID=A0A6A5ZN56_9PLEO|nr:G protein-coupled glucose receptor regulating Gpa2-domain-containing protein [Lophiotrema nucula]
MTDIQVSGKFLQRAVLSAPSRLHEIRTLNQVILAVSVLSMLGAGWICLSFCLFKQVRTFRHQLILGLAISDFWMAANFLSSCAVNLSGHILSEPPQQKFCSFNGFMTQLFVVQTDYWVLLIAISTFLILANHKHLSTWIQEHRIVLWCLPWGFSALWAALGLALAGYGDIGAWCWFTSDKTRLLVNFIPRWLIIIAILALYAHLYRIIYKAHNRFMSFDDASPHSLQPETESVSSTRRIGRPSASMNIASKDMDIEHTGGTISGPTHSRRPSPVLKKMAYQMMSYPLVYMFIWTIPTSLRIYQTVTGKAAPFGIATVDKACIVVQGFADALIYGVNESSLSAWREKFSRYPPTAPAPINFHVNVQRDITITRSLRSSRLDHDL